MASLGLLMQNYSDSEDDRSSDEEGRKKKSRRRSKEDATEQTGEVNKELNPDEEPVDKQPSEIEFSKGESNSLANSPELTPSLNKMKLGKLNEQPAKQQPNYQQDYYLEDDFEPMHSTGATDDEEMDSIHGSSPSIMDDDKDERNNAEEVGHNANSVADKLDCSKYSPRSFHRLLSGTDEQAIQIPDAPKDKQCPAKLTAKISRLHSLMKQGRDMNDEIQKKKSFRNPSIYEKLILHCGIDEFGTNLPPEIFDPNQFRKKETHEES